MHTEKRKLSDFTRAEFIAFVARLLDPHAGVEGEDAELVGHFNTIVPHPAGSDLLFWPEPGADSSAEGVAETIAAYCAEHDIEGFKD